jgi:outer membrane biosynthesis protein TonB
MQRFSPALAILLLVPLACEKQQGSTTTPSEPTPSEPTVASNSEPEPAPVEDEAIDTEALEETADEELSEEDQALWDEMTAEDAELEAEMEAEMDGSSDGGRGSGMGFGGRGTKVPQVRLAKHTVEGNLDADIVRRIARAHINEIRSCYNAGLTKDESLAGTVTFEFTIGSDGLVKSSNAVDSDAFADATVPQCVVKAIKKWKFPKPTGGEVKVVFPFVLDPG